MNRVKHSSRQKQRADLLLVLRGLAESRERAQALIMAGLVYGPSGRIAKAGTLLADSVELEVRGRLPFVSRGGLKLDRALGRFGIDVTSITALDIGASTGGFTDCLLQRGARHVYAVDVGHGQLSYKLRQDARVSVIERCNARYRYELPEPVDLVVIDVSFISLSLVIPPALDHLENGRPVLALVKPQFEAPRAQVGRGGIIKDPRVHAATLGKMVNWSVSQGLRVRNICRSPILGDAGNAEFFMLLVKPAVLC